MRLVYLWSLIGVLFYCNITVAQDCNISLKGTIQDAKTGEPVAFADVYLRGTTLGVTSNDAGIFEISNICAGMYDLVASHIGCSHFVLNINLQKDTVLNLSLEEHTYHLDNILVQAEKPTYTGHAAQSQVKGLELLSRQGQSLAQLLDGILGVQMLQTGTGVAKPVVQGLHSNRILILNNGIRQEGQQWGADHAPEIDPFVAQKITVVKGALGVKYGSDAIGGVIIVEPGSLFSSDALGGTAHLSATANGRGAGLSAAYTGKWNAKDTWRYRIQTSVRRTGNIKTPEYYLDNTGLQELNASITNSLRLSNSGLDIYYSLFHAKVGIPAASHIHNLTDLRLAIQRGRPLSDGSFGYQIGRPRQQVRHHLLKIAYWWENNRQDKWTLTSGTQYDDRNEFDAHRPYNELLENEPNLILEIATQSLDFLFEQRNKPGWMLQAGFQGLAQWANTPRGRLIPAYTSQNAGLFVIEKWRKPQFPLELELGARYDLKYIQLLSLPRGMEHLPRQQFDNIAWSMGMKYWLTKLSSLQFNLSSAWRAPNVNESFANGVHHGTASYEIGNPELKKEQAYNMSLVYKSAKEGSWQLQAETFFYRFDGYIFSMPDTTPTLTIRGAFPTFRYAQSDADLYGFNLSTEWHLLGNVWLSNSTSLLYAHNRETAEPLIWIPAPRTEFELSWKHTSTNDFNLEPSIRLLYVFKQMNVPETGDYLPPPVAYFLLNAGINTSFTWLNREWMCSLQARNLLNRPYRDYLNRLRYFSDEPGVNVLFNVKTSF